MSSFGFNTGYIEELYIQYLKDPASVSENWREFFAGYQPSETVVAQAAAEMEATGITPPVVAPPVAPPEGDGHAAPETPVAPKPAPPKAKAPPPAPPRPDADETALRGVSARIVENMEASLGVPTATSARHVPVKVMSENRRLMNDHQRYIGGAKVSFTHIIAWAIVQAVQAHPSMNAAFRRDGDKLIHVKPRAINFGLAIDIQKKNGSRALMVPNIKDAGVLNFAQFVGRYNDVVRRARTGKLELSDFADTTVTLTNPGMIGTVMSVPRLMAGQGLIIAVGAIDYPKAYMALPPAELARLGLSQVMTITSTYDHRVIQGAESGAFLKHLAELLQGEHAFFNGLFADLQIPHPPLKQEPDTSPMLGRRKADSKRDVIRKEAGVIQMIRAYRVRGHLIADINPLGNDNREHLELDPAAYGLTMWDLDRHWITGGLGGKDVLPLREILNILWATYTRKIGVEFMHISDPMEKRWLQERIETVSMEDEMDLDVKLRILSKLNAAEAFERFLHTKYIGHKRFSLEGSETLIPLLDMILSDAADQEVKEVVIGMAHRGRLNVLANTLSKPYEVIFSEFEGNLDTDQAQGSGDVKYHLGAKGEHVAPSGAEVKVTLAANPSHLEAVNPVVEGMARAKQNQHWDDSIHELHNYDKVIPILVHGDAAFAGQGVVAETLNLSQLRGYTTGGTIHVVVNNQIGFTTSPEDARSSVYATDVARMIQAPIFHVNGDDPEAAARVARIALDYRQVFNKDVVIDMLCYRVHGHNEGDEPTYTQPILYEKIKNHRGVRNLYTETLVQRGDLNLEQAEQMLDDFKARLQEALDRTRDIDEDAPRSKVRSGERPAFTENLDTTVFKEDLNAVLHALVTPPDGFSLHRKLERQLKKRAQSFEGEGQVDWALGEMLAFGTLLLDGHSVRLSGEDSRRGTFSHRHSVWVDQQNEDEYVPLNHVRDGQAYYRAFDSLLSEYAVLGYEYGYAVTDPQSLVIWEAQFGDFTNGGQIIIDQFISAAEEKWGQRCSLVMLLPHGYEGQGPEHSSARLERFLQSCAENNMRVCNLTTPANLFHALRRQTLDPIRKPLIVMSPKSLLRHPQVISPLRAFTDEGFQSVYPAAQDPAGIKRLVFCSGKVYYDLINKEEDGVAVARLEQFYPFPTEGVRAEINRYTGLEEVVWVQEEPKNMGGWTFVQEWFNEVLDEHRMRIKYIGRRASASTATGSAKRHAEEQETLVQEALVLA